MQQQPNKIATIILATRRAYLFAAFFSLLVNLLMLTVPIYMLQVFDRVLASQSYETLIYLTFIAILALMVMSLLDMARARILVRISTWLHNKLSPLCLTKSADHILLGNNYGSQCLRDINGLRQFLSSPSIYALFDVPWVPIYLIVVFLLHPILGVIALIGTIVLFTLALANEYVSRKPLAEANSTYMQNQEYIENALENSETIQAMGMLPSVVRKWFHKNQDVLHLQSKASNASGTILSISKFMRLVLQLSILAVGAYLVIQGELTAGGMIAGSILTARALAPLEMSIGAWKGFVDARQSFRRLKSFINHPDLRFGETELPEAEGHVEFENVYYVPPGLQKPIIKGVAFNLAAGEFIAIIGPSGAGKSTLARLLLGVWLPTNGSVRLDGANVYNWNRDEFGKQVGYLPQKVELFTGTVKENIGRMLHDVEDKDVVTAAQKAGAHDMILHLTKGYETMISSYSLSGGQAQRVALARAFFGDPCLIVLDEPESNLDKVGEDGLYQALKVAKEQKKTVLMITQRPSLIKLADKLLVIRDGQMQAFGPCEEVLKQGAVQIG